MNWIRQKYAQTSKRTWSRVLVPVASYLSRYLSACQPRKIARFFLPTWIEHRSNRAKPATFQRDAAMINKLMARTGRLTRGVLYPGGSIFFVRVSEQHLRHESDVFIEETAIPSFRAFNSAITIISVCVQRLWKVSVQSIEKLSTLWSFTILWKKKSYSEL